MFSQHHTPLLHLAFVKFNVLLFREKKKLMIINFVLALMPILYATCCTRHNLKPIQLITKHKYLFIIVNNA